jgi:hypothetical protein
MRILIYLLAMLTGFSAAEAARPVAAMPASVDASVGHAYAAAAVKVAEQGQVRPVSDTSFSVAPSVELRIVDAFPTVAPTTPVLRHDVILG